MNSHANENINLTAEEKQILLSLTVPVPNNETKRIEILRQSKLLDENAAETSFSRFTSLASRLFDMPYAAVSFVEVDRIHFKSKVGYDFEQYHRNEWFDAYTILPDSSEVYVIPDCSLDNKFKDRSFVKNYPNIQFYAGAAIMIDNYKIGVLSIMDTKPHLKFSLEDKENLLDLGAAAAQLAKEKLQKALNLSAERANIVVSMMHHLRTPMTSLNFATSLLCNDIQKMNIDSQVEKLQEEHAHLQQQKNNVSSVHGPASESKGSDSATMNTSTAFQAFESSFNEINMALNQLNILVDSSLSLGQAIIKCSNQNDPFPNLLSNQKPVPKSNNQNDGAETNVPVDPRQLSTQNNRFSECNILDYLTDMFHHHLPVHNNQLEVEWIIDTTDLIRGTHVTFPDAIMLIVISTISHMGSESNSLGFYFSFSSIDEDDYEYPELIHKMIEGKLSIKIYAKDTGHHPHLTPNPPTGGQVSGSSGGISNKVNQQKGNGLNTKSTLLSNGLINGSGYDGGLASLSMDSQDTTTDLLTKQNFLSIDKILRAINGRSKENIEDITPWSYYLENPTQLPYFCTIHEFLVPCKILLHGSTANTTLSNPALINGAIQSSASTKSYSQQEAQRLHFFRPAILHPHRNNKHGHNNQHTTSGITPGGTGGSFILEKTVSIAAINNSPTKQHISGGVDKSSSAALTTTQAKQSTMDNKKDSKSTVPLSSSNTGSNTATIPEAPPKPLKVLVVEDTIPVQKLLTRWLQNHGCVVTCANNGKIGLDLLMNNVYDIAFVDFLMPVMLGITTMKLYQEWAKSPIPEKQHIINGNQNLLIVGMSATALESEQEEAFLYGMHFFCPKPVSLDLLAIILDAKREFELNDDAVNKICIITGTNQLEEDYNENPDNGENISDSNLPPAENDSAMISTDKTSSNYSDGKHVNLPIDGNENAASNVNSSNANSKEENKTKWALFRSHKQVRKVHPESGASAN